MAKRNPRRSRRGERGDVFKDSLHLPVTYGALDVFVAGRFLFFLVDDEWYF